MFYTFGQGSSNQEERFAQLLLQQIHLTLKLARLLYSAKVNRANCGSDHESRDGQVAQGDKPAGDKITLGVTIESALRTRYRTTLASHGSKYRYCGLSQQITQLAASSRTHQGHERTAWQRHPQAKVRC